MRIGELSRRTGASERSLRYYEQQGLLRSDRTPGGHREFGEWAVDRVVRIQVLFAAGLSSSVIGEMLPCMRDADGGPNEFTTVQLAERLRSERTRIERQIADLLRSKEILDEVIETASVA